jgi:arylsulfatase A-like enzyme
MIDSDRDALTAKQLLAIAASAGFIFGTAEGGVMSITRLFPAIAAPYTTSANILWVAPLLDVVLFILIAVLLVPLMRMLQRTRFANLASGAAAAGLFTFAGLGGALVSTHVLHIAAVILLAGGAGAAVARGVRSHPRVVRRAVRFAAVIPILLFTLASATILTLHAAERTHGGGAAKSGVNVLVLVLDTVRRDRFWWAGGPRLTPNIDRITSSGIRYDDAWSVTSWSLPSQASILTGTYPHLHGADWPALTLSRDVPTLAEYFSRRGYDTGAFSSNSVWITPEYLGRGFDRFEVYTVEDHLRRTSWGRLLSRFSEEFGYHHAGRGRPATDVSHDLVSFLGKARTRPFFAYVCFMDVNRAFHHEQLNHPFWKSQPPVVSQLAAYDEGLSRLDADIGRLFAQLERDGMLRNTVVVITSDHGESFGPEAGDRNPQGHGTSLFPEQTRVPLYVVFDGKITAGVVNSTVSIEQIASTVAGLAGDAGSPFRGKPLPQSAVPDSSSRQAVLATLHYDDRNHLAVIDDGWEAIWEKDDRGHREYLIEAPVQGRGPVPGGQPSMMSMKARRDALIGTDHRFWSEAR